MGESAAETVREINDVRARLEDEIHELEERMPPLHVAKRIGGGLLVGTSGAAVWWTVRRVRKRRERKRKPEPMSAVIQVLPDRWADQLDEVVRDGRWRRPAGYAAGAWAMFKLAELRQLRKTNKLLAAR